MVEVKVYSKGESETLADIHNWMRDFEQIYDLSVVYVSQSSEKKTNLFLSENPESFPIIVVGPYILRSPFSSEQLEITIRAALDGKEHDAKIHAQQKAIREQKGLTGGDRFSLWFSTHYMLFFIVSLFLYVAVPFLAPVLMKVGLTTPAKVIYTVYSPLCHQLPYRSFFLFGEQFYYPRALAGMDVQITYEQITGRQTLDILNDRHVIGETQYPGMGYKVAICERCVAIYFALFIMAIFFTLQGRKLKHLPWYIWFLFGIIPMGLDGASQLPGAIFETLPARLPIRESTPLLRVITGSLFGITTAWFLFPLVEETLSETRRYLEKRLDYGN